jgi:hypothetical protein
VQSWGKVLKKVKKSGWKVEKNEENVEKKLKKKLKNVEKSW